MSFFVSLNFCIICCGNVLAQSLRFRLSDSPFLEKNEATGVSNVRTAKAFKLPRCSILLEFSEFVFKELSLVQVCGG